MLVDVRIVVILPGLGMMIEMRNGEASKMQTVFCL